MTVVLVISGNSVSCEQVKDILTNNSKVEYCVWGGLFL